MLSMVTVHKNNYICNMIKIYYMCHDDGLPVYVGSTKQELKHRRENHISDTRFNTPKMNWVREHKRNGTTKNIKLILLECCRAESRYGLENFWINYFKLCGFVLLNLTDANTTTLRQKEIAKKTIIKNMENTETRNKILEAVKKRAKKIEINGIVYGGVNEASRILNISAGHLSSMVNGRKRNKIGIKYI